MLYLSLISDNLTDQGIESLARGLTEMKNLESLGLVLIDNNITKKGAEEVANMLASLT